MQPRIAVRKALNDPQLLGKVLDGKSWDKWRVLLIASMGEKLTAPERKIFNQLTGRSREPNKRVDEFVAVVGRRGGKSRALSVLACYLAGLCEHELVKGETGVVLLIAPDQKQAHYLQLHLGQFRQLTNPETTRHSQNGRDHRTRQRHLHRRSRCLIPSSPWSDVCGSNCRRVRVLHVGRIQRQRRRGNHQRNPPRPRDNGRSAHTGVIPLCEARHPVGHF